MTQLPHNTPSTPTHLRHLSDWEVFCTFADVKVCTGLRYQTISQATSARLQEEPANLIYIQL